MKEKYLKPDGIIINQNEEFCGRPHVAEILVGLAGRFSIFEVLILKNLKFGGLWLSMTRRLFDKIERIMKQGYWSMMYMGMFMRMHCIITC
jgi:hypothetical protein